MKKMLLATALAITTSCYVVAPADAGNSIRGNRGDNGTGLDPVDNDVVLCDGEACTAGQELLYDEVLNCWTCCTGVSCGQIAPCDPTECESGDLLVWNDTGTCYDCSPEPSGDLICTGATCNDGDELLWNAVSDCFDCCTGAACGDVVPCDAGSCSPGDQMLYDPVGNCFDCTTPSSGGGPPRRFIRRDQSDTLSPTNWVLLGEAGRDNQSIYIGPDGTYYGPSAAGTDQGAAIVLGARSHSLIPGGVEILSNTGDLLLKSHAGDIRLNAILAGGEIELVSAAGDTHLGGAGDIVIGANIAGTQYATRVTFDSGVDHADTSQEGLRVPNAATQAGLTDPTGTDEGYIAWAIDTDTLMCNDGTTWAACGGGTSEWTWDAGKAHLQTTTSNRNVYIGPTTIDQVPDSMLMIQGDGGIDVWSLGIEDPGSSGYIFVGSASGVQPAFRVDVNAKTIIRDGAVNDPLTGVGNLSVEGRIAIDLNGGSQGDIVGVTGTAGPSFDITVDGDGTANGTDDDKLTLNGGDTAMDTTSGGYIEIQGINSRDGRAGDISLYAGNNTAGNIRAITSHTGAEILLIHEQGATDNQFRMDLNGFDFTGNSGDRVLFSEETDIAIEETGGADTVTIAALAQTGSKSFDIVDAATNSVFMMAPPSGTTDHGIVLVADGNVAGTDTGTLTCALRGLTCLRVWETDPDTTDACGDSQVDWYYVACVE